MGERRFVIVEIYGDVDVVQIGDGQLVFRSRVPCITESELKRRIDYIRSTASDWMEYDGLIRYLLHGEVETQPSPTNKNGSLY